VWHTRRFIAASALIMFVPAIAMGSTFVVQADGAAATDPIADLEWHGLGERRMDGFGRLAFHAYDTTSTWTAVSSNRKRDVLATAPPKPVELHDAASIALANRMTERMTRVRLDDLLSALAAQYAAPAPDKRWLPSVSQTTRLRGVFRDELQKLAALGASPAEANVEKLRQAAAKRINDYVNSLKKRRNTRDAFRNQRMANTYLTEWIEKIIDKPEQVWTALGVNSTATAAIGSVRSARSKRLALEYSLRLVHDTLSRAAKHKRHTQMMQKAQQEGIPS